MNGPLQKHVIVEGTTVGSDAEGRAWDRYHWERTTARR